MASEVVKIVDPDNGGGTDYTSLDAWEDALGGTTTGHLPNDDQIAVAECRSSSGTDDTTAVFVDGWTTDATRYIRITGAGTDGDFPADGIYDGTKYVLHNNDSDGTILNIAEDYVRIRKLQVLVTETSTNSRRGITIGALTAANNLVIIDSCIIKGACSGTGAASGVFTDNTNNIIQIYNTIICGFFISADTGFRGIDGRGAATLDVWNCTVYGNSIGIGEFTIGGTLTAKNCAVGNNDDDFSGTITMDYIVSDDDHSGDCANYHAFPTNGAGDWSLDFATPGSDFTLLATAANLIDDGLADLFTEDDDIIDTARPQGAAWDIGAFEHTVIGSVSASPSASISASPSASISASPSASISASPSASISASPSVSASPSASISASPSASISASPSASISASPSASISASPSVSASPSASISASPSASISTSPSASISASPSASVSASPSASPSASISASPSASISASPSASISTSPSASVSASPSASPSVSASPSAVSTDNLHIFSSGLTEPNHVADSPNNVLINSMLEAKEGAYAGGASNYTHTDSNGNVKLFGTANVIFQKAFGKGIQVDTATPTFGWRDLEGFEIPDPTGGDRPTLSTYSGGLIKENAFSNGDVLRIRYHIPHDYVKGTDIFSHIHWSHNGTAISGNVVFGVTSDYAKGHNQANFGTEKSISITYATTDISTTPRYRHRIEESAITNNGGSATLIDRGLLEPDGIILVTFEVTTNPTITGGSPNNVFVHRADLHYQSTNIATKQKAPDFYV